MGDSKDFSETLRQPFARQLAQISGQLHLAQDALAAAEQQAQSYSEPERKVARQQIKLLHVKFARFQQLRRPIVLGRLNRAMRRMRRFARFFSCYPQVVRWRFTNAGLWLWLSLLQILLFSLAQVETWLAEKPQFGLDWFMHFIRWIRTRLPKIFDWDSKQ